MSYIQDNLMPDEKVLLTASVHPAVFIGSVVIFLMACTYGVYGLSLAGGKTDSSGLMASMTIMLALFFLFIAVLVFIRSLIKLLTTEFAVTNRRVIGKTGLLRRHTLEILISKIESVTIDQNLAGRMINLGDVTVTGTGGTQETFSIIREPLELRKKILIMIENNSIGKVNNQ